VISPFRSSISRSNHRRSRSRLGRPIVWTNDGQAPHTVTGDFADSGILEPGQTFSHTFAEEGEFRYACAIHPQMVGTVRVIAAVEALPAQATRSQHTRDGPRGVWLISLTPDDESLLSAQQALVTFDDGGTAERTLRRARDRYAGQRR
jgi:hypothetical protein